MTPERQPQLWARGRPVLLALSVLLVARTAPAAEGGTGETATPRPQGAAAGTEEVSAAPAEGTKVTPSAAEAAADPALTPPATPDGDPATGLRRFRVMFDRLVDRALGKTARPVRFDWRKATVGVGGMISQLSELNSFRSARFGGVVRVPTSQLMLELGVSWVWTGETESTRLLALTPFRQTARPSRLELDLNVHFPVAEGIVTVWPSFLLPMEMVFSLSGGFRYLHYWGALEGARFRTYVGSLFVPQLTRRELNNLEEKRLPGMAIDTARYGTMVGFNLDIYMSNGVFVAPRAMVALPLLAGSTGTELGFWWELTFGAGVLF